MLGFCLKKETINDGLVLVDVGFGCDSPGYPVSLIFQCSRARMVEEERLTMDLMVDWICPKCGEGNTKYRDNCRECGGYPSFWSTLKMWLGGRPWYKKVND